MPPRTWSDTPADLLWRIIERLPIADYIRFGAVCVSWRSALSENRRPPAPHVPFLFLSHHDSTFHFLSLPEKKPYRVHIPDIGANYKFIGSSGGWIFTVLGESSPLHLFNPFFLSTHLRLRSLATNTSALVLPQPPDYFRKLVISSTPPATAAVICSSSNRLTFARVGDSSWTRRLIVGSLRVNDIVFFKDKLYAVFNRGKAFTIDLSDLSRPRINASGRVPNGDRFDFNYLVVSSRGDLLQVLEYRGVYRTTRRFSVFKMVDPPGVARKSWIELETLGDDALFMGHNLDDVSHGQSLALSANDFPEVRSNCIYFTDNHKIQDNGHSKCDLRVFNMEDKSIQLYCLCQYQTSSIPVWFPPIAAPPPPQQS